MKSFARPLAVCTVLALSLGSVVVTASAASAAETVGDLEALDASLAASSDVTLSSDITGESTTLNLVPGGAVVLDLAGHDLTVNAAYEKAGIEVPNGAHLTIKDSVGGGTLTSTGGAQAAGIGSGKGVDVDASNPGLVEIISGTVVASAGIWGQAAGIGGSGWSGGPAVTISGGDVTATAGSSGAGIGAGYNRDAASISISGGTVHAIAGSGATAIGGPRQSSTTSVSISGGYVTVQGTDSSVLGSGLDVGSEIGAFGTVSITGGTVVIPEGSFLQIPATKTLSNGGEIVNYGDIRGSGTLANNGSIVGSGTVTSKVTGHDYFVSFDALGGEVNAASVPVRAASFYDAGRSLPIPEHETLEFSSWNSEADGTGTTIDRETDLATVFGSATTAAVPATFYAMYGQAPVIENEVLAGAVRGEDYSQTLISAAASPIDFSIVDGGLPAGLELGAEDGIISGTPTKAGLFVFTVLAHNEGGADVRDFAIEVKREAKALGLAGPATPVAVGSKVTVQVSGLDSGEGYAITTGGKTLAQGIADAQGKASPSITVPTVADGQRTILLVGSNESRTGLSTLNVVAAKKNFAVSTNKKSYHYGQKATITVKNLAAGEKVSISFRGKTITPSYARATSKGTYTIAYSVGSTKGTKTIKVTGAKSTRAGSVSVKVVK